MYLYRDGRVRRTARIVGWLMLAALLCVTQVAWAQITIGDNLNLSMNGTLGYGYSGSFGDGNTLSSHGQNVVGSGVLSGYYYHPGFLSFQARPFWDRNQSNSDTQILSHSNGIDTSMSLFSGSRFPLTFSFGKTFSTNSQVGVPGVEGGLETSGSGRSFSVGWSELVPGLPPVYANFSDGGGCYTALGTNGDNCSNSKNFNAGSNYQFRGFNLSATFNYALWNYQYSNLLGFANGTSNASGGSKSFSIAAQHAIPLHGGAGISWGHSGYSNDANGGTNGATNTLNGNASIMPWTRLSINGQAQYTTNIAGAIGEPLLPSGGFTLLDSGNGSHSLSLSTSVSLNIGRGWTANGYGTRTSVTEGTAEFVSTQYGGSVSYQFTRGLFRLLRINFGLVDIATKEGNGGLSLVGSVGMDHRFGRWDTSADFSYSQSVNTLNEIGVNSNYSYGGSLRRKFSDTTFWSGSVRASHSGLSEQVGSSSGSESFSTSLGWRRYSVSSSYSKSRGQSILGASGLLTPVTGAEFITHDFVFFNGRSLSFAASTRLFRRLNVGGSYSKTHSTLDQPSSHPFSDGHVYNARMDYKLRKVFLAGGFSRMNQNASAMKNGPFVVNSFYLSLSRWFNVF